MLKKLRIKFILVIMVIVTVIFCCILAAIYFFTKANLETQSINMMRTISENPLATANVDDDSQEVRLPYFTIQINNVGELVTTGGGYYDLSDQEFLDEIMDYAFSGTGDTGYIEEYGLRYYISAQNKCLVFSDVSSEKATLANLMKTCLAIGVLAIMLLLAISILLSYWAVKPVEQAWQQQKQFMADASHELKTPLTVIMTNAELMQDENMTGKQRAQASGNILSMTRNMRSLVEEMLELARTEQGARNFTAEKVNMSEIVSEAILPYEPVFFEKQIAFVTDIKDGIYAFGNDDQLRRVVEILLDNAQKYTDSGGRVRITLYSEGRKYCRLSVFNTGTPLSAEEQEEVFERFYRSGSRRPSDGSFGLGLAIAKSIVMEHSGKIHVESSSEGNDFIVEIPVRNKTRL